MVRLFLIILLLLIGLEALPPVTPPAPELPSHHVGTPRSGKWPRVRREHLSRQPDCQACGKTSGDMEVHHQRSFAQHPELELDPKNLITLCADPCHLVHGHLMSFRRINPSVEEDCKKYRQKLETARGLQETGGLPP
jgi:hypothetical protein